jgi:hypothetical protein
MLGQLGGFDILHISRRLYDASARSMLQASMVIGAFFYVLLESPLRN